MAAEILDRMADREALEALAASCERFSPTVGVEAAADPECLLLDISGVAHLFGGEAALAEQVVRDFALRGLTVCVAVANTLGAAWAVAHHNGSQGTVPTAEGDRHIFRPSGVYKGHGEGGRDQPSVGARSQSPAIIPAGETEAALRPLPVVALRLADEALGFLRQLGIERIEQLLALPRSELTARFGPQVLQRLDQATGQLPEPVPERKPRPRFHARWAFDPPTTRRETVEQVLDRLLAQVTAMLASRGCGVLRLECRLACPPQKPLRVGFGLFEPTVAVKHLSELMRLQLERLRLTTPITAIDAEATVTAPLERRQQELFADDSPRSRPRQLAGLIDRLTTRLGRDAVVRARLKPDAQPELAWQCEPLVDQGSRFRKRSPATSTDWPPRPLQLLPHPLRLSAMSLSPDGAFPGGPPVRFSFHGCEHHVAHAWGPERIETGWWRGQAIGRDYFHVETTTGCRFWLFRRLRDGQWFLHGTFD
jgi:protein ImuB